MGPQKRSWCAVLGYIQLLDSETFACLSSEIFHGADLWIYDSGKISQVFFSLNYIKWNIFICGEFIYLWRMKSWVKRKELMEGYF